MIVKFDTNVNLQEFEEKYEAYCSLDEIAVFSSQDLNTDFIGCVREALELHDEVNFIAKFVLQHLDHYVSFCKVTSNIGGLREMGELIWDIVEQYGDKLEPEVKGVYMELSKDFAVVSKKVLPSRTVSFGCFYQMYGTVEVEIPGDVRDEEILDYIQSNWADMPLPRDGSYVNDSSELDVESIQIWGDVLEGHGGVELVPDGEKDHRDLDSEDFRALLCGTVDTDVTGGFYDAKVPLSDVIADANQNKKDKGTERKVIERGFSL